MRFILADEKKADVKKIEELPSVKGSFTQGGQFQVIIGNKVSVFFDEFSGISRMDGVDKQEVKAAAKGKMNLLQRGVANLAEIFAPIIPAIIVGGLILGFRNIIGDIKLLEDGTKSITEVYQMWAGIYNFLWLIGEAIFVFLPVGITWSVCKKMNVDQMLGIVLGITLVSPQLMSASDYIAAVEAGEAVKTWDFGAFHINMVGYQSQVIPAILVGLVFAVFYRFLKKRVPEMISMIVVPFCSLVPAVLLAHTVIGPFGRMIGDGLASIIMAGFSSSFSWLFSGIYGLLYPLLVITGLHHSMLPIDLQTVAAMGGIYTFQASNGDGLGDLAGIISRLDYLAELGADYLWITPFFVSPQYDTGYDIADYRRIDPRYGTMKEFETLVAEAGKRNMYLMMDMVFNHCPTRHEWFQKALEGIHITVISSSSEKGKTDCPRQTGCPSSGGTHGAICPRQTSITCISSM